MPSGITFAVARGASAPRNLVAWVFGIGLVQVLVAAAVLSFISGNSLATEVGRAATDSRLKVVVPFLVGLLCIAPCLKAILIGTQRVALASWLDILRSALTLPIVVLIAADVTPASPSVDSFVQAMVLGNVLGVVLIVSATWRVKSVGASAGLRTVIRFAAPAYAANVLQYLNYRLDLFLVAYFRDLRQVGLYALAATLTQLVWLISGAVATAVFARVGAAADEPRRAAAANRHSRPNCALDTDRPCSDPCGCCTATAPDTLRAAIRARGAGHLAPPPRRRRSGRRRGVVRPRGRTRPSRPQPRWSRRRADRHRYSRRRTNSVSRNHRSGNCE